MAQCIYMYMNKTNKRKREVGELCQGKFSADQQMAQTFECMLYVVYQRETPLTHLANFVQTQSSLRFECVSHDFRLVEK